jgi:ATP-dependent RNA helicase SUPV3L1/SUV3
LRKYGVRFGAYHIYLPALLKPAARALASLLWAQKQDDVDLSALSGAQHLAGSGRTSFPVDKLLDRDAYRVLGYRQCGERAVRVDILERLADLIRPALSWRETSPGGKPPGAFDGRGFVVTQAMTSLTGSAGEDFASILRALGYRMERRPAPPPKPAVIEAAVETAPPDVAAPEISSPEASSPESAAADAIAPEPVAATETGDIADIVVADVTSDAPPAAEEKAASSATLLPNIAFSSVSSENEAAAVEANLIDVLPDPAASTEAATSEVPATEAPATEAPQVEAAAETTTESVAVGDVAAADAGTVLATAPDAIAVPEMVDVWRPGGRSEERRPRHDRSRHRHHGHQDRPQEGVQPAAAAAEATDGAKRERHGRGRRDRGNDFRKPRGDAPVEAAAAAPAEGAPVREPRDDKGRPSRERFAGKGREADKYKGKSGGGRDHGGRDKAGRDKREGGPSHRQFATTAPPRERERPVDPNSPFAKLAALKEQLTANRKDQR